MRLINSRNREVIAERVERAATMGARLKGLLGRDRLPDGDALRIEPCTSIHTFFMKFSIDALFLGRDGSVLKVIEDLPPWRATRLYLAAAMVVELPAGTIRRTDTREGDPLKWEG